MLKSTHGQDDGFSEVLDSMGPWEPFLQWTGGSGLKQIKKEKKEKNTHTRANLILVSFTHGLVAYLFDSIYKLIFASYF